MYDLSFEIFGIGRCLVSLKQHGCYVGETLRNMPSLPTIGKAGFNE